MSVNPSLPSGEFTPRTGVSRRTVSTAAAWTVPAVAVAVGAPLASASGATGGTIVFSPAVVSAIPGTPYQDVLITATATSGTIDSPLSFVLQLPAGLTFADGATTKTITIPASNAGTATFTLTGPVYGVVALPNAPVGAQLTPTVSATTSGWTVTPNEFDVVANVVPGSAAGWVWGKNINNGGWNSAQGSPLPGARAANVVPNLGIVDLTAYGMDTLIRDDDTLWAPGSQYTGTNVPTLEPGELFISIDGSNSVLTSYGRVYRIKVANTPLMPFIDSTFAPNGAFITNISMMSTTGSVGNDGQFGTFMLDSQGRVWHTSSWATNTTGYAYDPKLVFNGAAPLSGIVEISAITRGALARTAAGKVYRIDMVTSTTSVSLVKQSVAGVVSDLVDVAKLGQMADDVNASTAPVGDNIGYAVIKTDGSVWSWGSGTGYRHTSANQTTTTVATKNTQAASLGRPVKDVGTVLGVTCVILDDNSVWSWGINFQGMLGQNQIITSYMSQTPGRVLNYDTKAPIFATRFYALYASYAVAKA